MILVDANLLLYAVFSPYPHHQPARDWLDAQLNGYARVGLPWPSLLAFVRLSTNPRLFPKPLSMEGAWRRVEQWLERPTVWTPTAGSQHAEILGKLLVGVAKTPKLVPDAHLAALAVEHGLVLCSTDGDFARFPGLRWENPLFRQ